MSSTRKRAVAPGGAAGDGALRRGPLNASTRGVIAAVVACVIAVGAAVPALLLVVVLALVLVFAHGWPALMELPSRTGSRLVIAVSGLSAMAMALSTGRLTYLVYVIAGAVLLSFGHEMSRRDGRPLLLESVSGTVAGSVVVITAVGWLVVGSSPMAVGLLVTAAAALAAAGAANVVPAPGQLIATLTTVLAVGTGALAGHLVPDVGTVVGGLIGGAAGVLSSAVHLAFRQVASATRPLAGTAAAVLPPMLAGMPCYLVGHLLGA